MDTTLTLPEEEWEQAEDLSGALRWRPRIELPDPGEFTLLRAEQVPVNTVITPDPQSPTFLLFRPIYAGRIVH